MTYTTQHRPPIIGEFLSHGEHPTLGEAVRNIDRKLNSPSTRLDGHRCTDDCHRIVVNGKKKPQTLTMPEARQLLARS